MKESTHGRLTAAPAGSIVGRTWGIPRSSHFHLYPPEVLEVIGRFGLQDSLTACRLSARSAGAESAETRSTPLKTRSFCKILSPQESLQGAFAPGIASRSATARCGNGALTGCGLRRARGLHAR